MTNTQKQNNPQQPVRRLPISVVLVAIMIAILHMLPVWRAQVVTPDDWEFTGNLSRHSPDAMQYRAWFRQTQETGLLGDNRFTAEPNEPHLPLVFFYSVGKLASILEVSPELIYEYSGALFAFVLTVLIFLVVRHFFVDPVPMWWVFLASLLGGGLGAYYKIIKSSETLSSLPGVWRLLATLNREDVPVWEDYRGNYTVQALSDSHSGLQWVVVLSTVIALYMATLQPSAKRLVLVGLLGSLTAIVHMYAGITLLAIGTAIWLINHLSGFAKTESTKSVLALFTGTISTLALLLITYRSGGLPMPDWRAINILFSILFIAYPLAWCLVAWGLQGYVRGLNMERCFLLGWIAGCTALLLSGPFYPYPDRGSVTLQIPLTIVAGIIYFNRFSRVTPMGGLVAVLLLAATPIYTLSNRIQLSTFRTDAPTVFLDEEHREVLVTLSERASRQDILLSKNPETKWLAPTFPGVHYAGHFFLTVNFARKIEEVDKFYSGIHKNSENFLHETGIRYVWVSTDQDPQRQSAVRGLTPVLSNGAGTLFEYRNLP